VGAILQALLHAVDLGEVDHGEQQEGEDWQEHGQLGHALAAAVPYASP
jgi:hypothetical protein